MLAYRLLFFLIDEDKLKKRCEMGDILSWRDLSHSIKTPRCCHYMCRQFEWIDTVSHGALFICIHFQLRSYSLKWKQAILQSGVMLLLCVFVRLFFFFYFTIQKTFLIIRFRFICLYFGFFSILFLFGIIGLISGYHGLWRIILSCCICFTLGGLVSWCTVSVKIFGSFWWLFFGIIVMIFVW